jgi:hypothetical protein
MEFQNDNNNNGNNYNNNPDEKIFNCDCGCGLSFQEGHGMGFKIMVGPDDVIQESKLCGIDWNDYIPVGHTDTWGELMDLFARSARDHPNDRVWCHLEAYVEKRDEIDDRTWLDYVYIN